MNLFADTGPTADGGVPNKDNSTLDQNPTNRLLLVNRTKPLPGISDHDTLLVFID
jgi:hypothetical protein